MTRYALVALFFAPLLLLVWAALAGGDGPLPWHWSHFESWGT